MPVNLELKAKYPNINRAEKIAVELSETEPEVLHQIDTYYLVPHGRLKLREIQSAAVDWAELIWYDRDEEGGDRISRYERISVDTSSGFLTILTEALSPDVIVKKQRTVYIWNSCRIHIDMVEQLGSFVEFEILTEKRSDENERLQFLKDKFGITDLDIINCSYSDLLRTLDPDY
jgi:adenylate cyclase class IV